LAYAAGREAVVFYDKTIMQYFSSFSRAYLHGAAILCLCSAALFLGKPGFAVTRNDLYQANTGITGRCESSDSTAFQAAMKTVLVRVTGRGSAGEDPALAPLISNARRYVQQCRSAPDNQLWVAFDGPAIERWLTQNGQPLWGQERPTTLVLLAVTTGAQTGVVVSIDDGSELKAAIDAAAAARGLPLLWPSVAELQRNRLDYAIVNSGSPSAVAEIGRRIGGEGVLIGRASSPGAAANVRWIHLFQDQSSEYSGTLEGVNRAADLYAGLFAASGNLVPVDIEVTGVNDLRDYAGLEAYLESLTFISHVSVESMSGDTIRFRVATRVGVDSLQRALSLSGRLQPAAAGENGIQRFQLHH
jgi:hypothetical protein